MTCIHKFVGAVIVLAATACSTDPVRVEQDYGNSVRNMIEVQTANPEAARQPSAELPGGLDGARGEKVIEAHRDPSAARNTPSALIRIGR